MYEAKGMADMVECAKEEILQKQERCFGAINKVRKGHKNAQ
jgi:hypothetical protein